LVIRKLLPSGVFGGSEKLSAFRLSAVKVGADHTARIVEKSSRGPQGVSAYSEKLTAIIMAPEIHRKYSVFIVVPLKNAVLNSASQKN
jgi:hypothetical protein